MTEPQTIATKDAALDPVPAHTKATREDWLAVALEVFIYDGVDQVKILSLAERLGVSRSSFYWYFKSREELLDALLDHWENTNTGILIRQSQLPATTISQAVMNIFECFIAPEMFQISLDFAVRDWARRSKAVKAILDRSDHQRIEAIKAMFESHGYEETDATIRARILYYMQIGYNEARLDETPQKRISLVPNYLLGFTGVKANDEEIKRFSKRILEKLKTEQQGQKKGL